MNIRLYKPPTTRDMVSAFAETLESGWLGYGPKSKKLESYFTDRIRGTALATSSCTSALYITAKMLFKSPTDEVIVPAITYVSTAMAFSDAGFTVKVADVDGSNLMLSLEGAERQITPNTKAVVVVHLYGQKYDRLSELKKFCKDRNLLLIEDCAHRINLDDDEIYGDFMCYSFNALKEVPAGEGGLLLCKNEAMVSIARQIGNVGLKNDTMQRCSSKVHSDYQFGEYRGLKLMLNDINASLALYMLSVRDQNKAKRKAIFQYYNDRFRSISGLELLSRNSNSDSFLMYVVKIKDRDVREVRQFMADHGVATSRHYPSLNTHPVFTSGASILLAADSLCDELITLPCYPDMGKKEQKQVADALEKAITGSRC